MSDFSRHAPLVTALRRAALEAPALTKPELRQGVAARASGGPVIEAPYDALARQIGEAAHRVTDAQVQAVLTAAGSEKAAFEIIAAAAAGASLLRWDAGTKVLREAIDATT